MIKKIINFIYTPRLHQIIYKVAAINEGSNTIFGPWWAGARGDSFQMRNNGRIKNNNSTKC